MQQEQAEWCVEMHIDCPHLDAVRRNLGSPKISGLSKSGLQSSGDGYFLRTDAHPLEPLSTTVELHQDAHYNAYAVGSEGARKATK